MHRETTLPSRAARTALALVAFAACASETPDTASTAFAAPIEMAAPSPMGSNTPSLVVDGTGRMFLSWTERRADSSVAIRLASFKDGAWDSTRTIAENRSFFVNWADFPAVSVLSDGALAAHWLEREGGGKYAYGVRVVRSTDMGKSWSAAVTPHTDGLEAEHGFVTMWPQANGALGLAWLDGRKSAMPDSTREMTVRTAVMNTDGTLAREAVLDARSCDCCQVASASTTAGNVVVYRDRTSEEIRDIAAVRSTSEGWTAPVPVHADNWHYSGCPVNGPSIAARGDTVAVAWFTAAHDTARVLLAISTDGGANFAAPTRVDDGDPIGRAVIAFDASGAALVGWIERLSADSASLRVRRVRNGNSVAAQTVSVLSAARQSGFPRMVVTGDTAYFAWTATKPSLHVQMAKLPLPSR
ncbi:MAG: exo-alpha-sialidase [Gemmatimonadaceae bacterium]|nr:exo-alpha-sialidase [Gemmatimonadaceae bacterium]